MNRCESPDEHVWELVPGNAPFQESYICQECRESRIPDYAEWCDLLKGSQIKPLEVDALSVVSSLAIMDDRWDGFDCSGVASAADLVERIRNSRLATEIWDLQDGGCFLFTGSPRLVFVCLPRHKQFICGYRINVGTPYIIDFPVQVFDYVREILFPPYARSRDHFYTELSRIWGDYLAKGIPDSTEGLKSFYVWKITTRS